MSTSNLDEIPCEICNQLVPFDQYIQHVETCYVQTQLNRSSHRNRRRNTLPTTTSNVINDDDSIQFISIEDVGQMIENDLGQFFTFVSSNLPANATLPNLNSNQNNVSLSVSSLFDTDFQNLVTLLPIFFNQDNNYEFNLNLQDVMGGNVEVGVTNKDACYNILPGDVETEPTEQCSICFQSRNDIVHGEHDSNNTVVEFVKTTCNHVYCKPCIDKWLSSHHTCPVCIHDFNKEEEDE